MGTNSDWKAFHWGVGGLSQGEPLPNCCRSSERVPLLPFVHALKSYLGIEPASGRVISFIPAHHATFIAIDGAHAYRSTSACHVSLTFPTGGQVEPPVPE